MGNYLQVLKESLLFSNLSEVQLKRINAICEERVYQKGDVISEQESPETELYIVIQGSVEISYDLTQDFTKKKAQDYPQATKSVLTISKGQSFGEVSLVDEGCRTANAIAKEDNTKLLIIWRRKLLLLCNSYPDFGYQVMINLASDLAQRFRRVDANWRESLLYGKY